MAEPPTRQTTPIRSAERTTNAVNALIHLYRAEMGRLVAYRTRLDTTTSWAVSSSALVATFTFGSTQISHAAFIFQMVLVYFFLQLEARRFRHYEASRQRVQLLEASFYPEVLRGRIDESWVDALLKDLRTPGLPVNALGALGWRLRRSYLWIFGAILAAWFFKVNLADARTFDPLLLTERASLGAVPGWLILAALIVFYAWLVWLAVMARRNYPRGDDEQVESEASEPA
ncbi:MAG TPA: DUF2270 domain-containing protein [Chloroflexota bacterium]|jgi:uncharacterized membrane protein